MEQTNIQKEEKWIIGGRQLCSQYWDMTFTDKHTWDDHAYSLVYLL